MLLKATELPNPTESKTDRENSGPNRATPKIASDEAQRAKPRNAEDAPRWKKSKTANEDSKRVMILKAIELANPSKSNTENDDPNRATPKILQLLKPAQRIVNPDR